jgi:hypothetical protein
MHCQTIFSVVGPVGSISMTRSDQSSPELMNVGLLPAAMRSNEPMRTQAIAGTFPLGIGAMS